MRPCERNSLLPADCSATKGNRIPSLEIGNSTAETNEVSAVDVKYDKERPDLNSKIVGWAGKEAVLYYFYHSKNVAAFHFVTSAERKYEGKTQGQQAK